MAKVTFLTDACKGCELCVAACPKKIVEMQKDRLNAKGFHPAGITDEAKCIACGFCAVMCPDCIITVEK